MCAKQTNHFESGVFYWADQSEEETTVTFNWSADQLLEELESLGSIKIDEDQIRAFEDSQDND